MNIIEATKTGKRFRRRGETSYYDIRKELYFTVDEVMANDWEVETTPVPVTRDKFDAAWHLARTKAPCTYEDLYQVLIRELGL